MLARLGLTLPISRPRAQFGSASHPTSYSETQAEGATASQGNDRNPTDTFQVSALVTFAYIALPNHVTRLSPKSRDGEMLSTYTRSWQGCGCVMLLGMLKN